VHGEDSLCVRAEKMSEFVDTSNEKDESKCKQKQKKNTEIETTL